VTGRSARACRRHRAALLEFVDRPRRDVAMTAAFDHLDRCPGCRDELAEVAQVVTVLRRLGREVERVEVPADTWGDLRDRITRPAEAWRWRSSLGGVMVSAFLVAVLIVPAGLTREPLRPPSSSVNAAEPIGDQRIEIAYLDSRRGGHGPNDGSSVARRSLPLLRTEPVVYRKEVKAVGPVPRLI